MDKKVLFLLFFAGFCFLMPFTISAHRPALIFLSEGDIQIENPEVSQAFYDELNGAPKNYYIDSDVSFNLYINLLVPEFSNKDGRYSANVFLITNESEEQVFQLDGFSAKWDEFYEPFGRDYYLKGPELETTLSAGIYKIEVYSADNTGKYVLAVGKEENYDFQSLLNVYWQLPLLKIKFFQTSVWEFFLTPFGIAGVGVIGGILIFIAFLNYLIPVAIEKIKQKKAGAILLTSSGMNMKDEIIKLLQKPAYDITLAFITTAAKSEENIDYAKENYRIMKEMGFNIQEIDIDNKKESELMKILELKDIIFVEGGNTFYLLNSMRKCNFEKIAKKLIKKGKVYFGSSAGSIVAGKSIKTAGWFGDKNIAKLKNLKGLGLVPFNVFTHYSPEMEEKIKKKLPFKWQRRKFKFLTDEQAILVQNKNTILLGEGEEIIIK
jgi:peptidase E